MLRTEGLVLPWAGCFTGNDDLAFVNTGGEMQTYLVVMEMRHGWKHDTLFLETYVILPEH